MKTLKKILITILCCSSIAACSEKIEPICEFPNDWKVWFTPDDFKNLLYAKSPNKEITVMGSIVGSETETQDQLAKYKTSYLIQLAKQSFIDYPKIRKTGNGMICFYGNALYPMAEIERSIYCPNGNLTISISIYSDNKRNWNEINRVASQILKTLKPPKLKN